MTLNLYYAGSLKQYNVEINNFNSLEKNGKYLYEFDLDSQLPSNAPEGIGKFK